MNDPRHPVQPAPATPAAPRPAPSGNGAPPQSIPRPLGSPAVAPQQRPAGAPHAPQHAPQQAPRPMGVPQPHAPQARPSPVSPPPLPQGLPRQPAGGMINPAAHAPAKADEEAIALVEDDADDDLEAPPAPGTPSKIKFGAEVGIKKHAWKRQPKAGGMGACRVRTFHGKLSDQGLDYIDEAINVWLDDHPEIDIKFVTTNVGMFDGKFKDLALIVNVWY